MGACRNPLHRPVLDHLRTHRIVPLTNLHLDGGIQVQALPVDPRPSVEQLCHEGDVVEVGFAGDVVRSDKRGQPNPFCPRDDQTCTAELCPLRVLLIRVGLLAFELVVQLLDAFQE